MAKIHKKRRKPSNADIRAMTCKSMSFDEFVNGNPEKTKKSKETDEPLPIPSEICFEFVGGKKYLITDTRSKVYDESDYLVYLRKDGIHHMFRNYLGGWLRCFTDPQLIGKTIEEVQ